ncbi:MAG TPA: YjbE family putative metal transport protein [Ktedonobacterales bacterium]
MNYSFWAAAAGIALVDIVLSGDNAIVIGAAASRLHGPRRMIAILFGGLGAIVLRLVLASVATTLLLVPYLRLFGGVVVFVIGVRLLLPEGDRTRSLARGGMFAAMLTIIIADITMSLDNVIAVGALADGNVLLLVAGITFSMVLLFVASSIIARLVEHMQWLMDVAAVVLAWTAANLILGDPTVSRVVHLSGRLESALHFYAVGLVLLIDLLIRAVQHHRASHAAHADAPAAAAAGELDEAHDAEELAASLEVATRGAAQEDGGGLSAQAPARGGNGQPSRHPAQARRPLH